MMPTSRTAGGRADIQRATATLDSTPASDTIRLDAVRAVEHQRQHGAFGYAGAAEVLHILGLHPGDRTAPTSLVDGACPRCGAAPTAHCVTSEGDPAAKPHRARLKLSAGAEKHTEAWVEAIDRRSEVPDAG